METINLEIRNARMTDASFSFAVDSLDSEILRGTKINARKVCFEEGYKEAIRQINNRLKGKVKINLIK